MERDQAGHLFGGTIEEVTGKLHGST
jgi:hypothetical protein